MSEASKRKRNHRRFGAKTVATETDACVLIGCHRPTQRAQSRGLSRTHCTYHIQFLSRHGSYWKRTYTAGQLKPYRQAAERHLRELREDPAILNALRNLELMRWGILSSRPGEWRNLSPAEKAKASLARLRDRGVPPMRVLEAYLAVTSAVREDPIGPGGEPDEFRLVQVAKAVFRLASGYHADYGEWGSYHAYPRSSGLVLRHLGRLINDECRHVVDAHLASILARQHQAAAEDVKKAFPVNARATGE